jgi:SAM-dependent methyltransferase
MNGTMAGTQGGVRETYDAFASSYDDFNHAYMNVRWTGRLLATAAAAGLSGDRLLDVGCGTGLSFLPMLDRGWTVTGCDISPGMLAIAAAKSEGRARLELADMTDLPDFGGGFDLIWAVNDAVNYLLADPKLVAALTGIRRNLAMGGVVVFDANTLTTYRDFFGAKHEVVFGERRFVWTGQVQKNQLRSGCICEARFDGEGPGIQPHVHRQRHFGKAEVLAAIESADLQCVRVWGERGGNLERGLDEDFHTKAVYVCRAAD